MSAPTIGVLGIGSIGGFVAARLARDGVRPILLARPRVVDEIAAHGIASSELLGAPARIPPDAVQVTTDASALADCDVVLVAVKSAQTAEAAATLAAVLPPTTLVVSLQNGVTNAKTLADALAPRVVVPAIVDFNVVTRDDALFHRGMMGPLVLERRAHPAFAPLVAALTRALGSVVVHDDVAPHQWTKLLVNLNNAVSALTGLPTRELLLDADTRRVIAAVIREALSVLRACGIRVAKLRGLPPAVMPVVLELPTFLARLVLARQVKVDPLARSSMWEDLERRRPTEVDVLNGEIVRRADEKGVDAPLNRRLVALVHDAERAGRGSPGHDGGKLWQLLHMP